MSAAATRHLGSPPDNWDGGGVDWRTFNPQWALLEAVGWADTWPGSEWTHAAWYASQGVGLEKQYDLDEAQRIFDADDTIELASMPKM